MGQNLDDDDDGGGDDDVHAEPDQSLVETEVILVDSKFVPLSLHLFHIYELHIELSWSLYTQGNIQDQNLCIEMTK